jgi:hypothetical protein
MQGSLGHLFLRKNGAYNRGDRSQGALVLPWAPNVEGTVLPGVADHRDRSPAGRLNGSSRFSLNLPSALWRAIVAASGSLAVYHPSPRSSSPRCAR